MSVLRVWCECSVWITLTSPSSIIICLNNTETDYVLHLTCTFQSNDSLLCFHYRSNWRAVVGCNLEHLLKYLCTIWRYLYFT